MTAGSGTGSGQDFTQAFPLGSNEPGRTQPPRRRRPLGLIAIGVLAAGLVIGGAGAAVLSGGSAKSSTNDAAAGDGATSSTVLTQTTAVSGGGSGSPPPTPKSPKSPAPTIVSFTSSTKSVGCLNPGANFPITLTWSTQDATGVALAADGVDLGSFDPSGSQSVKVLCDGYIHTYVLTAVGAGGDTTKLVSVFTSVPKAVITDLWAKPNALVCKPGDFLVDVHFTWATKNAKTVVFDGGPPLSASGILIQSVQCDGNDQHLTLTATGWGANNVAVKTVTVTETKP